jgi:hypothetical protein
MNAPIDEVKLRQLAQDLARDIKPSNDVLKDLGISEVEYEAIKNTRAFKAFYDAASVEWNAAGNTQKRAKLKAAAMVEETMHLFYPDITNRTEPLNARVGLLQTLAKIGGLGQQETATGISGGNGQFFKLEIHLNGREAPIVIDGQASSEQLEGERVQGLRESALAAEEPLDEF